MRMSSAIPAAGARPTDAGGARLNVTDCLVFPERPRTPPEQQKYRKSSTMAPGQRFQHYGIADDLRQMNLGERVYGGNSEKAQIGAGELINHRLPTELERIQLEKAEQVYRLRAREPLGRTVDRHIELPKKFTEGRVPFGMAGKSSEENAKDVIFPELSEETVEGDEIYRRSHGFSHPGEQKKRGYKWYVDPVTTRFGVKGDTIALNGVSKNIADVLRGAGDTPSIVNTKKVEDFRNMGDALGRAKNLGQNSAARPFDTIYGAGSASMRKTGNVWGAAEVIRGKYTIDQQLPDGDLGKSITPGFRNISLEDRAYGCPSIRDDLPKGNPQRRSLADTQNYGDDVPAQDLINPPAFSDLSIDPLVMRQYRNKQQLLDLFARIGQTFREDVGDMLFLEASQGYDEASINDFRSAVLYYLDAVKQGREVDWMRERGLA